MKEKNPKTFEENLTLLENLVNELEQGEIDLDKAISKYSEAMKLAKTCGDKLNDATNEVNRILNENGNLEDFSIEEEN